MSELAEEGELRSLFERFGRVTRVFLARDRETQRAKGFAFISYADRADAARACDKMDGCKFCLLCCVCYLSSARYADDTFFFAVGYRHLILRVEFAKRST